MLTIFPRLLLLILLMNITVSCIRDGEKDCITKAIIYVSVADAQSRTSSFTDDDLPGVGNATVYIFDGNSQLERVVTLEREDIENRVPIEITIYNGQQPKVAVWGNLNGSQEVSEPVPGLQISSARVSMLEREGYTLPPDELYYGFKELTTENVQEVEISSWVGRIFVTVYRIENVTNNVENCYFTIESKYNSYDFFGQSQAGNALLRIEAEAGSSSQEGFLVHQPVNLIAYPVIPGQRQSMTIRLYEKTSTGDVLIASADTDIEGDRIVTHPGENTNVLFDFTNQSDVEVYIKFTPWDYVHQWVVW